MKKVLVTGITGFLGRHLMQVLLDNNVEIVAIARRPDALIRDVEWIRGDLYSDTEMIISQLHEHKGTIDVVYHLAWMGVQAKEKNDYEMQVKNLIIAKNVVDICNSVKCNSFINSGTVAEYVCEDGLISNRCVPTPTDIYGVMKVASRNTIEVLCSKNNIGLINTIICSTYGEYRSDDNVISYTIKALLEGTEPEYGVLNQMWDFLYVKDVANGLFLIGEKGIYGKTYGIGSGRYKRLKEYITDIRNISKSNVNVRVGVLEEKYKRVLNSCVDSYQIQKDTGFYPRYSFEEGIARTIEYYRQEMNTNEKS